MELSADNLKTAYYGASVLFVAGLGWNGWRQGVARQLMTLAAIACAYAAAWYGASSAAPVFAFLKYPPQITNIIGGAAVGCATFLGLNGLRRWLFKRTAQQKSAGVRLSYGILGAILGVMFGSLLFLFTTGLVRAMGTVAKSRLEDIEREKHARKPLPQDEPGPLVRSFAKLGTALDEGVSGKFLQRYDNVPATHVFATLAKLGIMVSRPEAVDRFLSYPGVERLASHPKLVAVKNDPEISELLNSRSFVRLLRHEKVLALATDGEFNKLMKEMEFEKALDFALKPDDSAKPSAPPLLPPPLEALAAPAPR
jgi:uncharacterized membrane protein required for colicin V production